MTEPAPAATGPGLPAPLRPRPLEVACGLIIGGDPDSRRLVADPTQSPRRAAEAAVRRALARPPCLVSFSGGRDSSSVLALAVAVARRDGLPPPVPVTYRFAAAPGSHEEEWQERVVRHLGLPHWEHVALSAEIDTVGPVAQAVLARHGVLWPFNAHFHVPVLERAAGGSLLTGIGGDELFGRHPWSSARAVVSGRWRERPARLRSVGLAVAPRAVRRWALSRHSPLRFPWLRRDAETTALRQLADRRARTPVRWPAAITWWWGSRYRRVLAATMDLLATDARAQIVHPFLDPSVVAAVAGHFGSGGPLDRSAAMGELFGDLLPPAVLTRRSKAYFDEAFTSDHTRAFVAGWTGEGVDRSLVDADRLADVWRSEHPDPRSLLLMQAAWLATR